MDCRKPTSHWFAPYYAVIRFDASTKIPYNKTINLKQGAYTNVAKIRPLRDFVDI